MFERPEPVGEDCRSRAMQAIRDRWEAEESGGWTTLSVVERELAEIEQQGSLEAVELQAWRGFYEEVRSQNGSTLSFAENFAPFQGPKV